MIKATHAKQQLQNILSQDQYQVYYEDHRNFLQIWWDKAKQWVLDQLTNWFASFEPSNGLASIILIVIVVAILTLLVLVLFLSIRGLKRKRTFHDDQPLRAMRQQPWTFQGHLAEAERQESGKNYTYAVRHMFLALLFSFHEKGWLKAKSGKTNWEYYDELRKVNKDSAQAFYQLALIFDEVFYGEHEMKQDEYADYRDKAMGWLPTDTANNNAEEG